VLVRIVNHAATACAPGNLPTMQTMLLLIRANSKLALELLRREVSAFDPKRTSRHSRY
jgi:hypothetical protein